MGYGYYTVTIDGQERHAGYAVACQCDQPGCEEIIDRGLSYVCGDEPGETGFGCGRYFCGDHMLVRDYGHDEIHLVCRRCKWGRRPYPMKPDIATALADVVFRGSRGGMK